MFIKKLALPAVVGLGLLAALPASASPRCSTEPRDKWLSEAAMKARIEALGYRDIRTFQVTRHGCYEIYGRTADGRRAEVYFNPVTGEPVKTEIE